MTEKAAASNLILCLFVLMEAMPLCKQQCRQCFKLILDWEETDKDKVLIVEVPKRKEEMVSILLCRYHC